MEEINENYFIAIDGDDVGPRLRDFIISNDIEGSAHYSNQLKKYFEEQESALINIGAKIVFRGGDSILASHSLHHLKKFAMNINSGVCSVSVGISITAESAYLALQLAKARGKSQIVLLASVNAQTLRIIPN